MGYTLGIIVFNRDLSKEEETLLSVFVPGQSVQAKKDFTASQVFDITFGEIAIGHHKNRTLFVNPDIPYEFTRDFDFIPVSPSLKKLVNLSKTIDIMCVHMQSTSGIYGHALFSNGKRCEAVYKSEDEWETVFDCPTEEISQESYNSDYLFQRLNQFVDDDFYRWMTNENIMFSVYKLKH